jgi:hypothetical protein
MFVGCFLSCVCTQHLCLCANQINNNVRKSFVHQQQESQSLTSVTCCPMHGQNPTSICFCQLQVTILMTLCPCNALHFYIHVGICMSWSVFHCGYQHQVLTVRRFHNCLHNPDTICRNHYTVTDNILPFCKILGQDSLFVQK